MSSAVPYLQEVPELVERLALLEEVLLLETEHLEMGEFTLLAELQEQKEVLLPYLKRAEAVLHAIVASTPDGNYADNQDLVDLAVALMHLNRAATANERAIESCMLATQFTVRTLIGAMRTHQQGKNVRYSREGMPVFERGRASPASFARQEF